MIVDNAAPFVNDITSLDVNETPLRTMCVETFSMDSLRGTSVLTQGKQEKVNTNDLTENHKRSIIGFLGTGDNSFIKQLPKSITDAKSNFILAATKVVGDMGVDGDLLNRVVTGLSGSKLISARAELLNVDGIVDKFKMREKFSIENLNKSLGKLKMDGFSLAVPGIGDNIMESVDAIIAENKISVFFKKVWEKNPALASKEMFGVDNCSDLLLYINGIGTRKEFVRDDSNPILNSVNSKGLLMINSFSRKVAEKSPTKVSNYLSEKNVLSNLKIF